MSKWTHALCDACYQVEEPGRQPSRLLSEVRMVETCCRCGLPTSSGIYYRHDPEAFQCQGKGGTHD